jgi:beta-carotene ketolase (CrtW type)
MGILIALLIIFLWAGHLFYSLGFVTVDPSSPWLYFHVLIQAYLYTGLFITGHDSMHGTVSRNRFINRSVGYLSVFLFAGMWYPKLLKNHWDHHFFVATEKDPDYSTGSQNFFIWWFRFMMHYTTILQLVIMAILFNVLKIWFGTWSIVAFWIIPAFLGTFQLFYFGTYIPHKRPHTEEMAPHQARTHRKNHLWAMISCYFFGYHWEHHEAPATPWWQLYRAKKASLR